MSTPSWAATDVTTTHAGPASGKAVIATLSGPNDVVEAGGSFYISESAHRIRKVGSTGDISTIAGNGSAGFADGTGSPSRLNTPAGLVAFGADVLIADSGNHAVRKLTSSGTLSTIAGTGGAGAALEGGTAATEPLNSPTDVATDGTVVYVADSGNNKVMKIDGGGLITTFAGGGAGGDGGMANAAQLNGPTSLALDGNFLYVGEGSGVRRVELISGIISTLSTVVASGLAVSGGTVYASEASTRRVLAIDTGGVATVFAGSGASGSGGDGAPAASADFMRPAGLAVNGSDLLVADDQAGRVRRIAGGIVNAFAGTAGGCEFSGDGGPATSAMMGNVTAVASDGSTVYLADGCNLRIRRVSSSGTITTIAGNGTQGAATDGPALAASFGGEINGLAASGSTVYLSDTANNVIRMVSSGQISNLVDVTSPQGLAVDVNGVLYVAAQCRVWRWNGSALTAIAGTGVCSFSGADGTSAPAADMRPQGLAVDGTLRVFVAEAANNRVRRINIDGTITTIAGNGFGGFGGDDGLATSAQLSGPSGVAVGAGGIVFVADKLNNRVRRIRGDNIINTVAGTGVAGFSGDSGDGVSAQLSAPNGLALSDRTLYVADGGNKRVRKVSLKDQKPPPLAVTSVTAPISNATKAAVQVGGTGEKDATVTLTVTNGTTSLAPVTKVVNSTGNWTVSPIDVSSFADGNITFTANAVDKDGNIAAPHSMVGVKDTVGGVPVSPLTKIPGNGQVRLEWTNPTSDPEFDAAVVRMAPGTTAPASPTDGTEVPMTAPDKATATGLVNCEEYSFAVFARDRAGNYSSPVTTVARAQPSSAPATSTSLNVSANTIYYGSTVTLQGTLVQAGTSTPVHDQVELYIRRAGTTSWVRLPNPGMSGGSFASVVRPAWNAEYRAHFRGNPCAGLSNSPFRAVVVRPVVLARLGSSSILLGSTTAVSGTIQPAQYGRTIYLQQAVSGTWKTVAKAGLWGTGSTFAFPVRPGASGRTYYRIFWPGDADTPAWITGAVTLSVYRATIIGIAYDPKGEDARNLNGEYATLRNTGAVPIDLFGWTLHANTKNKTFKLPHYSLAPGAIVHVRVGSGTNGGGNIFMGRTSTLWTNGHDMGRLFDPRGSLAGSFRY